MFAIPARDTTYFTPNAKFYVVNYADCAVSMSRDINIEQWKLHIKGAVNTPMSLGWRDILNRDSYDQVSTLMCIDTLPGGDSMGNATWRGISLKKLLKDAGADEETARDVVFRGIDGYDDSIPFKRAMQDDVMLAFLMNGEKLPKEHGFPIRLLVPGLYGIKNVKWIVEIEVYPGDYQGYWQRKGWTDDGTIKIFSRIDSAPATIKHSAGRAEIPRHRLRRAKQHQQSGTELRRRPHVERVRDRTADVALLLGHLELHMETASTRQIPNRRARDRYKGAVTDCGDCPATAGGGEWVTHHYYGCRVSLAAAENARQLRSVLFYWNTPCTHRRVAFPLSLATLHTATGWGGSLVDEVPNHLLNHAGSSLLPKPLNCSFKVRQAGLQFRRRDSGYHKCCRHMLPMPQVRF